MSAPILLGANGAIEQPQRYSGGPFKPTQRHRSFRGPKASVQALIGAIRANKLEWVYEESGLNATMGVTYPTIDDAEAPVDTWDLHSATTEKDILEADIALVNSITSDEKRLMREAIANPTPGSDPALTTPNAIDLYLLMLNGLRTWRVPTPTFTRTRTFSAAYNGAPSQANLTKIFSNDTLFSAEDIPSNLISLPASGPSTRDGLVYGWYKASAAVHPVAHGMVQATTVYDYGLWPTLLYGDLL